LLIYCSSHQFNPDQGLHLVSVEYRFQFVHTWSLLISHSLEF